MHLVRHPRVGALVLVAALPLDQRGVHRPIDGNGDGRALCDIGALERTR